MRGAGGTGGGQLQFLMGVIMFTAGLYLFLANITVANYFGMGTILMAVGGFPITTGYVLVPFIFGIGMVFYNKKNILGWLMMTLSLLMLFFGIVTGFRFTWRTMTAFETIVIIVLLAGGLGMFLRSLSDRGNRWF